MLNPPSAIAFKKIISFYSKDTLGDPKKSLQSTQTMNFILRISMVMHVGGRNSELRSQNFRNGRKCPTYIWLCILVLPISVIWPVFDRLKFIILTSAWIVFRLNLWAFFDDDFFYTFPSIHLFPSPILDIDLSSLEML